MGLYCPLMREWTPEETDKLKMAVQGSKIGRKIDWRAVGQIMQRKER